MRKHIRNFSICFIALMLSGLFACASGKNAAEKDYIVSDDENNKYLLKLIDKINSERPRTLSTKFNIEGYSGKQKFKSSGIASFDNNPVMAKIIFHDAVFKSAITEIVQEGDILRFYFPLDKILYVDNFSSISLQRYTNFNIDFNLIYDLSVGKIPMIKDFLIVRGLETGLNSGNGEKLIIIENSKYYETISFDNEIPDKILWVDKDTKHKFEVYLEKPVRRGAGILYYKLIRIVSPESDLKISIQYTSIKINVPVDAAKLLKMKVSPEAKIIKVN